MLASLTFALLQAALPQAALPQAAPPTVAQTPDPTLPPSAGLVVATALGKGVQIYVCSPEPGAGPTPHWIFEAPEATLIDLSTNLPTGKHFSGPTWVWSDGSTISGRVFQTTPSSEPGSVPSLLLHAQQGPGSPRGVLTPVTLIRRSGAHGGAAPAGGCDSSHVGTTVRVPYTATYTFFKPEK